MGSQDDGSSIQVKTILCTDGRKYILAGLNGGVGRLCEPEVSKDPHAEQIVAEVTERTVFQSPVLAVLVHKVDAVAVAAVHRIAVGRESPILPEIRCGNIGDGIAVGILGVRYAKAGRGRCQ